MAKQYAADKHSPLKALLDMVRLGSDGWLGTLDASGPSARTACREAKEHAA
jgi:hypothetical protein